MIFAQRPRGQTATEYVILLAVVLVVGLISSALLGFNFGFGAQAKTTQSGVYWSSAKPLAVLEAKTDSSGGLVLVLRNSGVDTVTVKKVTVGGTQYTLATPVGIDAGQKAQVSLGTSLSSGSGTWSGSLSFVYDTPSLGSQVESGTASFAVSAPTSLPTACLATNQSCSGNSQCCSERCAANSTCACQSSQAACPAGGPSHCCTGTCSNGAAGNCCVPTGSLTLTCGTVADCCGGANATCTASMCCFNHDGVGCVTTGGNPDWACCSTKDVCELGKCCYMTGKSCSANSYCCSNNCTGNLCQCAVAGTTCDRGPNFCCSGVCTANRCT